jgi:hypothetical protein
MTNIRAKVVLLLALVLVTAEGSVLASKHIKVDTKVCPGVNVMITIFCDFLSTFPG